MKKHVILYVLSLLSSVSVIATPQGNNVALSQQPNMSLISEQRPALEPLKSLLSQKKTGMRQAVIDKVLVNLKCAHKSQRIYKPTLAVIDFSLPANQKRFWVFDLDENKLLFHTYISHGIKSGELNSSFFSNRHNSKASSIGVYKTLFSYYGRHGYALRLAGLEDHFNDNARGRAIVMHGSWYVEEPFIKKYGRPGRSWGCPSLPMTQTKGIIDSIKDDALLVAYYPSDNWFAKSKYINCEDYSHFSKNEPLFDSDIKPKEHRKPILYVEKNDNDVREENEPILVIPAKTYSTIFNTKAPLKRMLRRKINDREYIALNHDEFKTILHQKPEYIYPSHQAYSKEMLFVIPEVKKLRGYYATEMKEQSLGKIKHISEDLAIKEDGVGQPIYLIERKKGVPLQVKSTGQFIRWLGL